MTILGQLNVKVTFKDRLLVLILTYCTLYSSKLFYCVVYFMYSGGTTIRVLKSLVTSPTSFDFQPMKSAEC